MINFLNLRNRLLQSLILGLVGLTLYAYYRTTVNEIHPFAAARSGSQQLLIQVFHGPPNTSVENGSQPQSSSSRNSTWGPTNAAASPARSPQNPSAPSPSVVAQQSSSSSSASSSNSLANETLMTQRQSSKGQNETSSGSNGTTSGLGGVSGCTNDTARAIYGFGHDVAIPEKCPDYGKDMDLAILVMSAPSHVEARTAIRQTWGHYGQRRDVAVLFMLGSTRFDPKLERLLKQESSLYGDVIRGRYVDSYSNLTLKTISSLEWVSTYCPEARFMLKTDDDMFINVPRLLAFVRKHEREKNVIFGRLAKKWKPIRNKKSKYYVSQAQYKPPVFPDFTTGPAYLLSRDVVNKLYEAALDQTYLKLEDVFTTGIVAHKLGVRRSHANEFLNKRIAYNPCNIQRGISIHMVKYSEQFDLWKKLLDGKTKCKR